MFGLWRSVSAFAVWGLTVNRVEESTDIDLHDAGFILLPNRVGRISIAAAKKQDISVPRLVGDIPNLQAFSIGSDITDGGFLLKSPGQDRCLLPQGRHGEYTPLLPTIQRMIDHAYSWPDAKNRSFILRASRHTAKKGEPHQKHIPGWHDHIAQGSCRILAASDIASTQFKIAGKEVSLPDGKIAEFDETTTHRTPVMNEQACRTFLVLLSYEKERKVGRVDLTNPLERLIAVRPYAVNEDKLYRSWRAAAVDALAQRNRVSLPVARRMPSNKFTALNAA
ncbi:MAG: hypothetical protein WDO70_11460 [Alphaproteobacteria bacterium]